MIAVEYYPVGIGKHIVCIYDRRNMAADIQTLVGESPNPLFCRERITTKTITKNKLVALRFCENEYNLIKSKADKANMNFTEFVTRSALNKQITVVDGLPKILNIVFQKPLSMNFWRQSIVSIKQRECSSNSMCNPSSRIAEQLLSRYIR